MQAELQLMIKDLALKYKMSAKQMEALIESPYRLAAEVIESGDRERICFFNVRIPSIGIFIARAYTMKNIRKDRSLRIKVTRADVIAINRKLIYKKCGRKKK